MTDIQAVCTAAAVAVVVSIGLAVAGVAVLFGVGWALIAAGATIGPTSVGATALLLREIGSP